VKLSEDISAFLKDQKAGNDTSQDVEAIAADLADAINELLKSKGSTATVSTNDAKRLLGEIK